MTQEEGDRLVSTLCVPHWQDKTGQQGAVIKGEIATKDISVYTTTKPLAIPNDDSTKRSTLMVSQIMP